MEGLGILRYDKTIEVKDGMVALEDVMNMLEDHNKKLVEQFPDKFVYNRGAFAWSINTSEGTVINFLTDFGSD